MINLEIDGKAVQVENGRSIIDAANKLGVYVPHFCYHRKLSIAANCRMCLVQVEKAPKPLPACATPATEGMKVFTHSEAAIKAQKGVMEFLLINHPLDCPICDQGGECQLQDLAVGYGGSGSRYTEDKRVVVNKNLGPLISTDMTRCIHCTRCVRFGEEIAGVMELGMIGRGEHAEIIQFVGQTIDSELSGNMIDVCPVGALTSKPFRYTARTWELTRYRSVSPHDGLGSNLIVQVKQDRVMRVLPRENEDVNECWLADRDRFSYEALNSEERLKQPLIRRDGHWHAVDWREALEFAAAKLQEVVAALGPGAIGALASPHQTLEELYLLQRLMRGLGTGNVDHRLRQSDFSSDGKLSGAPWLGFPVKELTTLQSVLVVGSVLRKEHPLIAQRLRQAAKKGAAINFVNPVDDEPLMRVANKAIVAPGAMVETLAQVLKSLVEIKQTAVPESLRPLVDAASPNEAARNIAATLARRERAAVLLGNLAQHHPQFAQLHALSQAIAAVIGARFGVLAEAANSVGGTLAGCVPYAGALGTQAQRGMNAREMLASPRAAYLLLGAEPEMDCHDPQQAMAALRTAQFVVALSPYRHRAAEYAHVMLPISPFTETAGSFVNMEGRVQSFNGVVKPLVETRPAWKVLRVLATMLGVPKLEFDNVEAIRQDIAPDLQAAASGALDNKVEAPVTPGPGHANGALQRVSDVPIYRTDAIVRRAPSLQKTHDAAPPAARMSGTLLSKLGISAGERVRVKQGAGAALLRAERDDSLPDGVVRIAAAHPLTVELGAMFGEITVERAPA
jgi:NADH-quinone oxidoreductase subunit G